MMTLFEAADYLSLKPATIRRLARDKQIPAGKIGRMWRFNKDHLDEFLHKQFVSLKNETQGIDAPRAV